MTGEPVGVGELISALARILPIGLCATVFATRPPIVHNLQNVHAVHNHPVDKLIANLHQHIAVMRDKDNGSGKILETVF